MGSLPDASLRLRYQRDPAHQKMLMLIIGELPKYLLLRRVRWAYNQGEHKSPIRGLGILFEMQSAWNLNQTIGV